MKRFDGLDAEGKDPMKDAKTYECGECGASGVKLWRQYQTFLDHQELFCQVCAEADQGKLLADGYSTDQIGWLVPAVPTAEGDTFWGYTSVPEDRCIWWRALPAGAPGQLSEGL